jgi:predicted ArsR family transcriptional regulator
VLAASGYEPHLDDDTIVLRNCPFHALAREHTTLVCGMNLALIQAVTDRLGDSLTPRLDPGDGRCCVLVDTS